MRKPGGCFFGGCCSDPQPQALPSTNEHFVGLCLYASTMWRHCTPVFPPTVAVGSCPARLLKQFDGFGDSNVSCIFFPTQVLLVVQVSRIFVSMRGLQLFLVCWGIVSSHECSIPFLSGQFWSWIFHLFSEMSNQLLPNTSSINFGKG